MHKYIHIFYIGAIILLSTSLVISFARQNALLSRVESLKFNLSERNIKPEKLNSEKTFKEDYYIKQQSSDTTLILSCFGLGFVIFTILTYSGTVAAVQDEVRVMKDNYKNHKQEYEKQAKDFNSLKKEFNLLLAINAHNDAKKIQDSNPENAIKNFLLSCTRSCTLVNSNEDKEQLKNGYAFIIENLKEIDSILNRIGFLKLKRKDKEKVEKNFSTIKDNIDTTDLPYLSKIIERISFEDN